MYFNERVTRVTSVLAGIRDTSTSTVAFDACSVNISEASVPRLRKRWNFDFGAILLQDQWSQHKIVKWAMKKIISEFVDTCINYMAELAVVFEWLACDWVEVALFWHYDRPSRKVSSLPRYICAIGGPQYIRELSWNLSNKCLSASKFFF